MRILSWTAVAGGLIWIILLGLIALVNADAEDCPFSECGDSYIFWDWLFQFWLYLGLGAVPVGILGTCYLVTRRRSIAQ